MPLDPGTHLGPYQIESLLGEGGMGQVYRALDPRLGRMVAIKILPETLAGDPARADRFEREARAVAALSHPHIGALFDIGNQADTRYLVMECLEGQTLAERMAQGPLPLNEVLGFAVQMAEAVHYAHTQGVIHRDIKPANVVLTATGAKILDFGLAKMTDGRSAGVATIDQPTELATRPHTVLGTAHYMSPEQARGLDTDHRTDIWSLGVLLYEMLAGRRPFEGATAADVMACVLKDEIDWGVVPGDTPAAVLGLLKGMTDRHPETRYDDLAAAAVTFREELAGESLSRSMAAAEPAADDHSIVVLPFANTSPDPDNEYFSDGLTEEIIADLSKVGALRVISRTTAMRLKGMEQNLRLIATELSVRYVLEGSVRKAGNNLRITSQLIDTRSDSTLWSDKFGGTMDDVFEIQERVSRSIVDSLKVTLTPDEDRDLAVAPADPYVYDVFLRARRDIWSFEKEGLDRAKGELEAALEKVGDDELLLRGLGLVHWQYVNCGVSSDPSYTGRAEEYARKILALNPDSPHAAFLLSSIAVQRGDRVEWIRQCLRAVRGAPHDSDPRLWAALGWIWGGYPDKAQPYLASLESTDPLFDLFQFAKGLKLHLAGDFELAINQYQFCRNLSPTHPGWPMVVSPVIAAAGRPDQAVAYIDEFAREPESHPLARLSHIFKFALQGDGDRADELAQKEYLDIYWIDFQYSYVMAQAYSLLSRTDEGLKWLARSIERGFWNYPFIAETDPLIEVLRAEPHFGELLGDLKPQWEGLPAAVDGPSAA